MSDTPPPRREIRSAPVSAIVRPSVREAFRLWAAQRGLTLSGAVEGLMIDALLREVTASSLGPLTRDLRPEDLERIVAVLRERDTRSSA
ncbi:MAG TPA: hypothetical protein VGH54_15635 [Mycobacterium sp.]|jgi:hypothetical protein|uniref:hypothetical protein n=1 Tax=Mycobacterium sp. TaxID=1785 RepID=UPI002F3E91E9